MNNSLFSLTDKVIVMTGATGVLGQCMARYLDESGAVVCVLARQAQKAEKLLSEMSSRARSYSADVLDRPALEAAHESIVAEFGRVDVLVNLAGGNQAGATIPDDKTIFDVDTEALRQVMDLNLFGTVLPTLVFAKTMAEQKQGSIINIASLTALRPLTRVMGYGLAKAAVVNLTQYLSAEMARKFSSLIRVNAIAPGFFLTEQNRALLIKEDGSLSERAESIIAHTPMARFGEPEELLGALHYLCAEASRFMTGEVMVVDGGFNAFCI